jgi:hypothetical protein
MIPCAGMCKCNNAQVVKVIMPGMLNGWPVITAILAFYWHENLKIAV